VSDLRRQHRAGVGDDRAGPLLTRALITTARELDPVAVLGPERRRLAASVHVMGRLMRMGGG
jgi:hypothetical protein